MLLGIQPVTQGPGPNQNNNNIFLAVRSEELKPLSVLPVTDNMRTARSKLMEKMIIIHIFSPLLAFLQRLQK